MPGIREIESNAEALSLWVTRLGVFPSLPLMENPVGLAQPDPAPFASGLTSNGIAIKQCAVTLAGGGTTLQLPIDPTVTLKRKNIITRRNVAKGGTLRGTVKETWREDDWDVTLAGVLRTDDSHTVEEYISTLRLICGSGESIRIYSSWLNEAFDITRLVADELTFPVTKGLDYQAYSLKAWSDDSYTLIEEIE